MPRAQRFDFDDIPRRFPVDRGRLYRQFVRDVAVLGLPALVAIGYPLAYLAGVVLADLTFAPGVLIGGWLVAVGISLVVKTRYKYPGGEAEETTVLELLADPYASPVRGDRVALDGELIGRGQAGYRFSADLMFKDSTGMIYINYESWLPLLGNFLFSIRNVPELIGERVEVEGWYLRGMSPWIGMSHLDADEESIRGFIHYGGLISGGLLTVIGLVVLAVFGL
jgi:hypothetical protein